MILEQIKKDSLVARKAKEKDKAALYSLLISLIEGKAKDEGRDVTDEDCIKMIRKFVNNYDLTREHLPVGSPESAQNLADVVTLEKYLPKMVSEADLRTYIGMIPSEANIGQRMGAIRKEFGILVDMKLAAKIINERN
jgi:uncharacterized protein YqeY